MFGIEMDINVQIVTYILIAGAIINWAIRYHQRKTIQEKVEDMGGQLLSCKQQYGVFNAGPFPYDALERNRSIYYYVYVLNGQNKNGWVKFSLFGRPDWR